jgi:serine phosphatase RsbU (regulator of sigma subunit)
LRSAMSLPEIVAGVRQDITQFTQNRPQSDDISLLALKFRGEK